MAQSDPRVCSGRLTLWRHAAQNGPTPAGLGMQPAQGPPALVEPSTSASDLLTGSSINAKETAMTHWHDTMVDRPESDGAAYVTGWTVSGLVVLGAIVGVWLLGI
jgi:hypothetical protein